MVGCGVEENGASRDVRHIRQDRACCDFEENGDAGTERLEMPETENVATFAEAPFSNADAQIAIKRDLVGLEVDEPHSSALRRGDKRVNERAVVAFRTPAPACGVF